MVIVPLNNSQHNKDIMRLNVKSIRNTNTIGNNNYSLVFHIYTLNCRIFNTKGEKDKNKIKILERPNIVIC